jgi:SAM-dependent methyltransferase
MSTEGYDQRYYETVHIDEDRIALWYYARVACRLCPSGRLFDFGCGTGHLLKRLTATHEAIGYDASPYARTRARLNAPEATVLEEWQSLPPESIDVIVSLHTLEHLPRPQAVMEELVRRLKPAGHLLFVVPNTSSFGRRWKGSRWFGHRDPTHHSLLSQGEWVSLARRAGLQILWVQGDGWWDAPYLRLVPVALQRALFGAPAAVQLFWPKARPFLPPRMGECLIVAAQRL